MANDSTTAVLEPDAAVPDSALTPEPELEIEPARWEHAPIIVEILRSSAEWYEDIVEPEDLDEHYVDMDWARENLEKRDFYVGRVNGEIAGTISLQPVGDDAFYLGYVYLHTDHVGNGFGSELLDFAREKAEREGRSELVLIAHPEAVWACKAYKRYGFEVIARDRDEVLGWHDGWLEPYYEVGFELYRYQVSPR